MMSIFVAMGVCWKTPMSPEEFSGKEVSTDWSVLRKCAGNLPVMPGHLKALNTDSDLQLARTPISPEDISRKIVSTDWFASEEICWKLTRDAAPPGVKHRQRLAIGQDADVT